MHQLAPRYRSGRIPGAFETEHCINPGLDVAVILLDQIVQILRRSQRRLRGQKLVRLHFAHPVVRRCVTVQRDCLRCEPLSPDRFPAESRGRSDIAPCAEPEVDRLSCAVNCTVKIDPFATDFQWSKKQGVVELFPCRSSPLPEPNARSSAWAYRHVTRVSGAPRNHREVPVLYP